MRHGLLSFPCLLAWALLLYGSSTGASVVRGVNLGGWLVTEPWITPLLFNDTKTDSEWALCSALGKDKCRQVLEKHWSTFITRDDIVQIKNAGLNSIRIPLGYWSIIDLEPWEPFVSGQYPYLLRAVQWAKELGLTVFLDLHGAPGNANGWEESGSVLPNQTFTANSTNTERTLAVLKNLTAEFSQVAYHGVVTNIEPLNEPTLDYDDLRKFYTPAADVIGAANKTGINMTISDGFFQAHSWTNYSPWMNPSPVGVPHVSLDLHYFFAFPPLDALPEAGVLTQVCEYGVALKAPNSGIPPALVGEWSLSTGVTANTTGDTAKDQKKRTYFRKLFEAQVAAYSPNGPGQSSIGWYFWTWTTYPYDIDAWSYKKGLQLGYIPSNVSDPTTFALPIKPNGCIDETFAYEAPAFAETSALPTSTGSAPAASSSKSTASSMYSESRLLQLAVVGLFAVGMFT